MNKKLINKLMTSKAVFIWGIILFIGTLILMEYSPWGSHALEQYNGGYGTFDMKSYNTETVYRVLDGMEPVGFKVYRLYFILDFLFIIGFGIFQIRVLSFVLRNFRHNVLVRSILWIPVARGIFDAIENIIILVLLAAYPLEMPTLVKVASIATFLKLKCITLWSVCIMLGIIANIATQGKKLDFNNTNK